jgi:hypothetical protein
LGVFDDFVAVFENRVVKGEIKEKEKAKKEYDEGVKQGHMMGYAEIKEKTPDIMQVKLGNLPAKSSVTIKLSYLQKLEISQNKFWKLQLLGTLTPRFMNGPRSFRPPIQNQNPNQNPVPIGPQYKIWFGPGRVPYNIRRGKRQNPGRRI